MTLKMVPIGCDAKIRYCWSPQVAIVEAHRKAVTNGHFTYDDPVTGLKVLFLLDLLIIMSRQTLNSK